MTGTVGVAEKASSAQVIVKQKLDRRIIRRFCEVTVPANPTQEDIDDAVDQTMVKWILQSERLGFVWEGGRKQAFGRAFAPRKYWITDPLTGAQDVPSLTGCPEWTFLMDGYFHHVPVPIEYNPEDEFYVPSELPGEEISYADDR